MQATLERLRARRDERGDEGGFTLIELLIVIVILAILAAIVVFAVQNLTGSSAKASCESDVSTVDHAIQAFAAQMGKQPTAINTGSLNLMPTTQYTGSNGDPVGPWLHNVPTNGTHYSVVVWNDAAGNAFPAVEVPGSATPPAVAYSGTGTTWNAVVYEANGTATPAAAPTTGATPTPGNPQIVTTPSAACAGVNS